MTQKELAETIGCSESKITRIETGRVTPSRELLERIAAVLDVPSESLAAEHDRGR
jgi:transcriptional regulator with XRE-family HTH domain